MSSESPISMNGNNPCYVYFLRFNDCVKKESFCKLFCNEEFEDYAECKTQRRSKGFRLWYAYETRRTKILSLPQFDDKTDSFVSGHLPKSADNFFNDEERLKEFFKIKTSDHLV